MAKKEKVTVIVLEEFQDKFDHKTLYPVGTELEVDKERADDLVGRKLASIKEVKAPKELKKSEKSKEVMKPQRLKQQKLRQGNLKKEKKMMTRGLRNNNPLNIRLSGTTRWQGEVRPSQDRSFCQFESMAYGYRAGLKLLQNYRKLNGCRTISDFINRWAPSVENNTSGYISRVCREMQVPSSYVPDVNDRGTMCAFAAAMSQVENGIPAVMEDVQAGWDLL